MAAWVYHACQSLATALGDNLESVLGNDEANVATDVLKQSKESVLNKVKTQIAAYTKVFSEKGAAEQAEAKNRAEESVNIPVFEKHHKVECPACRSDATVEGDAFGPENVAHEDGTIMIRQQVAPKKFSCGACGLKLNGYAELDAAELGGTYTRTTAVSPEDYYGLIDPGDYEPEREYDNE